MTGWVSPAPARFGLVTAAAFRRDLQTAASYRAGFVLDFATIALELGLFYFLGDFIDTRTTLSVGPGGYFGFVIIGIAMVRLVSAVLGSPAGRIRAEQSVGTLEACAVTPTSLFRLLSAGATYALAFALLQAALLVLIAGVFLGLPLRFTFVGLLAAVAGGALTVATVLMVGLLLAAVTLVLKQVAAVVSLFVNALILLGGVYYPVSVLPAWLTWAAWLDPLRHGLDSVRAGLLEGRADVGALAFLVVATAVLAIAAERSLRVAERHAMRRGTFAQY